MAHRNQTHIVEPNAILNRDQVLREDWILVNLGAAIPNTLEAIIWLAKRRLLKNTSLCGNCNILRSLVENPGRSDHYLWRCRLCRSSQSIRKDSFFERSHLPLQQIIIFIYCWAQSFFLKTANRECGGMSEHTQTDWGNFCRDVCEAYLFQNQHQLGGYRIVNDQMVPAEVEIDESFFFKRKANRGRYRAGSWVFGGIERDTGKTFLVVVEQRDAATLENAIQEYILPGTRMISDGWAAYGAIDQINGGVYTHNVAIREENFVGPFDPTIHTQNIENC